VQQAEQQQRQAVEQAVRGQQVQEGKRFILL